MDLSHAAQHVTVPSLVVVGDLDRITPPASAKRLAESLPDARLVTMKGAGHMAPLERHGPFNRVLERFLDAFERRPAPAERA